MRRTTSVLAGFGLLWAIGGCASGSASSSQRSVDGEGQRLFGSAGENAVTREGWAVALAMFAGSEQRAQADAYIAFAAEAPGVGPLRVQERDGRTIVSVGSFEDPRGKAAQSMLRTVRSATIAGRPVAPAAILLPPPPPSVSSSPFDLSTAREGFRTGTVLYTLQVGLYGDPAGGESPSERAQSRAAANQAVQTLRAQGEDAYVHHGDQLSTVSIGVFREDQLPRGVEGPAIRAVRTRHPHTLLNGTGVRQTSPGQAQSTLQPSLVVQIPE